MKHIDMWLFRFWFSLTGWGLLNLAWKRGRYGDDKWGVHLFVVHRDQ